MWLDPQSLRQHEKTIERWKGLAVLDAVDRDRGAGVEVPAQLPEPPLRDPTMESPGRNTGAQDVFGFGFEISHGGVAHWARVYIPHNITGNPNKRNR